MHSDADARAVVLGEYIAITGSTLRQTAAIFHISKSTVHKDVTERLPHINRELFTLTRQILDKNKAERHIRGGLATKKKYQL